MCPRTVCSPPKPRPSFVTLWEIKETKKGDSSEWVDLRGYNASIPKEEITQTGLVAQWQGV